MSTNSKINSVIKFIIFLQVIKDSFCQDEAVSIGSEVNKNLVAAQELLELCADAALDCVSLVAIDTNSGQVVAVAFNKLQVITFLVQFSSNFQSYILF